MTAIATDTSQTIRLSAGAIEYTWPVTITETTGKDISSDTVQIGLGTYTTPGAFHTPDLISHPTDSSVTVQLLIGDSLTPTAGAYYVWVKISDSPEIAPRRASRITIT